MLFRSEAVSGQLIIKPFFADIFGALPAYQDGNAVGIREGRQQFRLGLLRASGPFSHPIHFGTFLVTILPLFFYSGLRKWPLYFGVIAGALTFFSLSSATFLGLALFAGAALYDKFQRMIANISWKTFFIVAGLMLLVVQIGSEGGVLRVLIRSTLDPQTGYFRLLIWEHASRSVELHPWFGIGFTEYARPGWMPPTIDSYWLSMAVRHGLVTSILFLVVLSTTIVSLIMCNSRMRGADSRIMFGVIITLALVWLLAFTVSYFGGVLTWVLILFGIGVSLRQTYR